MGNYSSKDGGEGGDEGLKALHHDGIPSRSSNNGARSSQSAISPQFASQTQPSPGAAESQQGFEGDMENIVPTVFKVPHRARRYPTNN